MSRNILIAGIVVGVVIVAGWFFTRPKVAAPVTETPTAAPVVSETSTPSASPSAMMAEKNMVAISATGFSPMAITVKVGDSVTWENTDSANHTVSSDPHPTHTLFPFLNVGVIKSGDKKSVTFDKAGKYTYHDHLHPSNTGVVTVE